MKKLLAILFAVVVFLAAGIPTMSASADGGDVTPYWEFYNDIVPGEEGARLIHLTGVQIYEVYVVECDGERTEVNIFAEPWSGVALTYEEGDVRLKELGALVSWFDPVTELWTEQEWIVADQSCGAVEPEVKYPVWTGRWVHTYPGSFWCSLVSFEKEPIRFKNPEYVDYACSRDWPWEGSIDYKVFKEMRLSNGDLKAGNHYYVPAGQ